MSNTARRTAAAMAIPSTSDGRLPPTLPLSSTPPTISPANATSRPKTEPNAGNEPAFIRKPAPAKAHSDPSLGKAQPIAWLSAWKISYRSMAGEAARIAHRAGAGRPSYHFLKACQPPLTAVTHLFQTG